MNELDTIFDVLETGDCLAFLGEGACREYRDLQNNIVRGLPSRAELAKLLGGRCNYPFSINSDLARVGEYFLYKNSGNRVVLEDVIVEEIQKTHCSARPIHTVLAQLKGVKVIMTTNYDGLMEEEAQKYRNMTKHYFNRTSSYNARFDHPPILKDNEVVVYKMYGTVEKPETMIITESDFIYYLSHIHDGDRGIPGFFKKTWLPFCNILFLGYSLEDWDFKVIWEGMLSDYRLFNPLKKAYILVNDMEDNKKDYWGERNINVIKYDLTEFSKTLAVRFNLQIPQLNIPQTTLGGVP